LASGRAAITTWRAASFAASSSHAHVSRDVGLVGEDIDNRRVESIAEQRNQLGANAVSRDRDVGVRLVIDVVGGTIALRPAIGQPRAQLVPAAREQRPDDAIVARMHCGEAARPGAADQAEQERFRLVVARVPERDDVGVEAEARAFEERIARRVRRVFDRATLGACARRDVLAIGEHRDVEGRGHRDGELLVPVRRGAELMIEVGDARETKLAARVQLAQQRSERDRVRSARHRGDDARLRARQIVIANELPDAIDQGHRLATWVEWVR
jgi:hypothetical protein